MRRAGTGGAKGRINRAMTFTRKSGPGGHRTAVIFVFIGLLVLASGCGVYFNTFYHAKKAFNAAEKARKKSPSGKAGASDYNRAIEKARIVTDDHPNSKYYDDALYVLGVSYYHTGQYGKSERRLRELLANYNDPKLTRDARLYLAKAKLHLNEVDDAMEVFQEIFQSDYGKSYKAEAAMALGEYRFESDDWAESRQYFMSVRDSLGDQTQKLQAQLYLADGYFKAFQFNDALGGYLQALEMQPDKDQKYHSLFNAALSSYRMMRIDDGQAYLAKLATDPLYYDSSAAIQLMVAQGYEYEDDIDLAEATYQDVAEKAENKTKQSQALYRLGLIYQYDYDRLKEAKDYYDRAAKTAGSSEWGKEAVKKSADIGKIDTYTKEFHRDSTTTQDQIDDAAYTQYLLGELYWFQLDKPDTAMIEMQYLIDSFPASYDAPRAMVALASMYRDLDSNQIADSILRLAVRTYPHSDYIPDALDALGLRGTAADTGYAEIYFHRAENWLVDSSNYDSARFYYQKVIDDFPDSKYFLQAKFNLLWAEEQYHLPGDSSLILAYEEFIDSFPGTRQAEEAKARITVQPQRRPRPEDKREDQNQQQEDTLQSHKPVDTAGWIDPRIAIYNGPNGEKLTDLTDNPTQIEEPFEFPTEAYTMQEQAFYLYFQILVDFSGKVVDLDLKIPSTYDEVNRRATLTVASMTFDPMQVSQLISRFDLKESPDGRGYWFVFKYLIEKPDFLK